MTVTPDWSPHDRRTLDLCMASEHFLGRRISKRLWGKRRDRVAQRLPHGEPGLQALPEFEGDHAAFVAGPLADNRPVVMRGVASEWPAVTRWTPDFFKELCGDTPVRVLYMAPDEHDAQEFAAEPVPMSSALDRLHEGNRAYLRFLPTLMQNPALLGDLDQDWLRARQATTHKANAQLFMGGAGTATALHTGISSNLFVQIHGTKRWTLYAPEWTHAFRPPVRRSLYFESRFDPDAPDHEAYPNTRGLTGYEVVLNAGDVLFNPPFWWHQVDNPTLSIGVGLRWMPLERCFDASRLLTLLTLCAVDPPVLAAPMLDLDFTRMFSSRRLARQR